MLQCTEWSGVTSSDKQSEWDCQYVMSGLRETAWHICFQAITITNADGLASCLIRSPVIKVLIMQNKWFLDFHEGGRISITLMLNKCKKRYVECKQTK